MFRSVFGRYKVDKGASIGEASSMLTYLFGMNAIYFKEKSQ